MYILTWKSEHIDKAVNKTTNSDSNAPHGSSAIPDLGCSSELPDLDVAPWESLTVYTNTLDDLRHSNK
jgi:hypothetical protein